jgi:hypothetical protein
VVVWSVELLPRAGGVVSGVGELLLPAGEVVSGRVARLLAARAAVSGSWEGVAAAGAPVFGGGTVLFSSGLPLPPLVAALAGLQEEVVGPRTLLKRTACVPRRAGKVGDPRYSGAPRCRDNGLRGYVPFGWSAD